MARVSPPKCGKASFFVAIPVQSVMGLARRSAMPLLLAGVVWMSLGNVPAQAGSSFDQKIASREARLGPKDAVGHTTIAQLLYRHKEYKRALEQVNLALTINPHLQDAELLKKLILRQLSPASSGNTTVASGPAAASQPVHKLLTMKQIYLVRLWELSRHETGPLQGMILSRTKTLNKFWHKVILMDPQYQNPPPTRREYESFISPTNLPRQIQLMRELGGPAYWKKIEIQSDPDDLRTFRTYVQPFVLQSCSTIGCHRGQDFKGFKLFGAGGAPTVRQTYTNFYILTHYRYKGQPLVNLDRPQMSLILQYVADPDVAAYRHPGKKGGPKSRKINTTRIVNWIESLRYPRHSYGFSYQMPKPAASQ